VNGNVEQTTGSEADAPTACRSSRIPSLDGLRALAIVLVLFDHVLADRKFPSGFSDLGIIITNGGLGVSIFFVMSGFLITILLVKEERRTGEISLKNFYIRRVCRIFPACYLYLGTIGLLMLIGRLRPYPGDLLRAATFVWNFTLWRGNWCWYVAHTWSLSVEEQFYILWPTALVLLGPRRGLWLAGMILIACPILRFLTCVVFPDARFAVGTMTATRADTLMFGCAAALLQGSRRFERICDRIDLWRMVAPATLLGFVISPLFAQHHHPFYNYVVSYSVEGLAITVIMLWLIRHADSVPGRILNAKPVVHIGVISYSLYLWQQLFLAPPDCELRFPFPASILFVLAAAEASHFLVEQPFVRLGRRFK
jgi:peptidoglycan/LPS O-acetylase OafA/YrhL